MKTKKNKAYIIVSRNIYHQHHLSLWTDNGCWEYGVGYGRTYISSLYRLIRNGKGMVGFWSAFANAIMRFDFRKY